jgi:hypothetical protein
MSGAWSVTDGPQSDYESLRAAILEGRSLPDLALRCFERQGLAGLILRPVREPVLTAVLLGAQRPPWSPYEDPRQAAMAKVYEFLLGALARRPSN